MAATLRPRRPGDLGWLLERHAALYAEEFGYLPAFEEYVARSLPPFLDGFDARLDAFWVAESDGQRAGSIAVHHDPARPGWAKLRWFLVEREARGRGIGAQLLGEALRFARGRYDGIWLSTVSDLDAARRGYERAGFRLAREEAQPCPWAPWGREQRWELAFAPPLARDTGPA